MKPGRTSNKICISCDFLSSIGTCATTILLTFPKICPPHAEPTRSHRVFAFENKVGTAERTVASASFRDLQETAARTPALARLLQGLAFLTASGHVSKEASKGERVREKGKRLS